MRILGLDIGDRRIGVALSDPMEVLASALTVIERKGDDSDFEAVKSLVDENRAGLIVVGLPRLMSGDIGTQARKTEAFIERLRERVAVPVEVSDERLSTDVAEQLLRDAGKTPRQIKGKLDAAAAALILQWYLDRRMPEREYGEEE
ncbi:MAG: Holliday junction resolvase RuvX [Dehalococcoidia bacterium]